MPLDVTPGAASADSYADLVEADAYNASRLHSTTWTSATDSTKEAALRMAARLLDAAPRCYTGAAVDAIQALSWPRSGMLTRNGFPIPTSGPTCIPQALKDAQAEFARQLIDADRTADNSIINQGITSISAGSVSLSFADVSSTNSLEVARVIRELNALAAVLPDAVKFLLVASWLLPDVESASQQRVLFLEVV